MKNQLRLFIAVEIASQVRSKIARHLNRRVTDLKRIKWVAPDQFHLTLKFLGDVPPVCVTAESGDAVNPWTSAAGETDRNTVIIVPDGRLAAYMAQKGIGDWFTSVREKSGSTTGMAETTQDGKVPRSGVWSLTGRYIGAPSVAGTLPSGVYIINGRKTAL